MWIIAALLLVLIVAVVLFMRPPAQVGESLSPGERETIITEQGEVTGVVYGTYWLTDAQSVWSGDDTTITVYSPKGGKK